MDSREVDELREDLEALIIVAEQHFMMRVAGIDVEALGLTVKRDAMVERIIERVK